MTNAYELRTHFFLEDYNTAILREDFERFFTKTKEKVTFTFNGWDGKSYDGESRTASVYRTSIPGFESVRLIKVGISLPPALLTMLGVCGVRIAWIQWVFPQSRAFKTIMTAYPISLSTTALLVLTALLYYHPSRGIESARA